MTTKPGWHRGWLQGLGQPLDRVAGLLMGLLAVAIALVIALGDHASPQVRQFSWQDRAIGSEDTAFILTFNRPMDQDSVADNLNITPALPGKISWAGRRMAYTLDYPAPYGEQFELSLTEARDRFSRPGQETPPLQPFQAQFRTRDRAFVYLGATGEESGRLVLVNLTQQTQQILTPPDLMVLDFEPYPAGDRLLFAAIPANDPGGLLVQALYTVTTGLPPSTDTIRRWRWPWRWPWAAPPAPLPAGTLTPILASDRYQNLRFDLAPNGEFIVVQRVNRDQPTDFGPWIVVEGEDPVKLETDPGGDFLITPDSSTLVLAQGEGLAIVPLDTTVPTTSLEFLPRFGIVLNFARDGTAAAMVKFNTDFTRSLFLVTNQGQETELLRTEGSILEAQFDPTRRILYVLVTRLLPGEDYIEQPLLTAIDLTTQERTDLLLLPIQRQLQMSLAPDGLGLLFDQTVTADTLAPAAPNQPLTEDGNAVQASELWFLPLVLTDAGLTIGEAESLGIAGLNPQWLP